MNEPTLLRILLVLANRVMEIQSRLDHYISGDYCGDNDLEHIIEYLEKKIERVERRIGIKGLKKTVV